MWIVTVAVSVLLCTLTWPGSLVLGSGQEPVSCEVDNPRGSCVINENHNCVWSHEGESADCRDELQRSPPSHMKPECYSQYPEPDIRACKGVNASWYVSNDSEALQCSPDKISFSFHHFSHDLYTAEVHWEYDKTQCEVYNLPNLQGFQVRLDAPGLLQCTDGGLQYGEQLPRTLDECCNCIASDNLEGSYNFTVKYGGNDTVTATVFGYRYLESDGASLYRHQDEFTEFANCYELPEPDLEHCGVPTYSKPTNVRVTAELPLESNSEMNLTITWDPPAMEPVYPDPTAYYIRINSNGEPEGHSVCWNSSTEGPFCFKVTNSTMLTVYHLNASNEYFIEVQPYRRCAGSSDKSIVLNGCGIPAKTSFARLPTPTPTPSPVQAPNNPSSSTDTLAVGLAVGLSVVSLVILVTVVGLVVIYYGYVRRQRTGDRGSLIGCPPERLPRDNSDSSVDSKDNLLKRRDEYTGKHRHKNPKVLVVYSDNTPEDEKAYILHHLIGALRQEYGIDSTSHDCFSTDGVLVYQISETIEEINAVLCVCNPAFYEDWRSESRERLSPVINALKLHVASDVAWGGHLGKFAMVFVHKDDMHNCLPSAFLKVTKQFHIEELEDLAYFITGTPKHETVPIGSNLLAHNNDLQ